MFFVLRRFVSAASQMIAILYAMEIYTVLVTGQLRALYSPAVLT